MFRLLHMPTGLKSLRCSNNKQAMARQLAIMNDNLDKYHVRLKRLGDNRFTLGYYNKFSSYTEPIADTDLVITSGEFMVMEEYDV